MIVTVTWNVIENGNIEQSSPAVDCRRSAKSTREAKLVAVLLRVAFFGALLVKRVVLPIRLPPAPALLSGEDREN